MKLLFVPISIGGGLIGGQIAKKLFEQIWGVIDTEEPPKPTHRQATWPKIIAAAALEGAIFRATKQAVDHGARTAFANATGTWPGEERPEKE
jgi:hypothetical protein